MMRQWISWPISFSMSAASLAPLREAGIKARTPTSTLTPPFTSAVTTPAMAVVEPGQQAVAGPLAEMMIDRLPRREVFGQEPPLGTGLDQIKDGVEDFA